MRRLALIGGAAGVLFAGCTPFATAPHLIGSVEIAADLPLSGDDAPDGRPVEAAINLAVAGSGKVCGAASHVDACVTVSPAFYDDVNKGIHDPATGVFNLRQMAADARIVAMVGPLYDSLARSEVPVANAAGLAMVSPSNTDECLTQEPADGHCQGEAARLRPRGTNNYFRVVTTQLVEGDAAADLAAKIFHTRHAFVVEVPTPLGHALATEFTSRFRYDGGATVSAPDLASAQDQGADVVYFAGSDLAAAAAVRRQMGTVMPTVPLIGPDRLASNQFALAAGVQARGSYYTIPGPYPPNLNGVASFLHDYRKSSGGVATASAVAAFDAANLVIRAIARAIDDAGGTIPSRQQVLREVASTKDFHGLMGVMSLDPRGDTTLKLVAGYQWMAPADRTGRFTAQLSIT